MLSMKHARHRLTLPTKDKMVVVADQIVGSFVPCRRNICRFELVIPDRGAQEIGAAQVVPVSRAGLVVACAGSYQGLMMIALFSFS
jgi:hypothetical protein